MTPWNAACHLAALVLAAFLVFQYSTPRTHLDAAFTNKATFARAGQWIATHLPAGARVGALSSGLLNAFSPNATVVNLDGLANNRDFLDNVLRKDRMREYFVERGLDYFSDYMPASYWRKGIWWRGTIPLENMQLLKWWPTGRIQGEDELLSYGIWRVAADGRPISRDPCAAPCDAISQLGFEAFVLEQHETRPAVGFDPERARAEGKRVAASFFVPPAGGGLHHILLPRDHPFFRQTASMDVPERRAIRFFGGNLELTGFELYPRAPRRGGVVLYSLYWRVHGPIPRGPWRIDTYVNAKEPGWVWLLDPGAHGTYPVSEWKPGDTVVTTYAFRMPTDIPTGFYPVRVGLWQLERTAWAQVDGCLAEAGGLCFLANIEAR